MPASVKLTSMTSPASANACPCSPTSSRAANISCPNWSPSAASVPLMKMLLDAGLLHGDCLTVTGQTMAETWRTCSLIPTGQTIIRPLDQPLKKDSHLVILYGNLAPEGAVAKITGKEGLAFQRQGARVRLRGTGDGDDPRRAQSSKGDVIVIRYEGPKGGPGHARNARAHHRHHGQGPRQGRRAHHRRPLLRRQPRFRRRPHHARKPTSAAPSPSSRTAMPSPSMPRSGRSTWRSPPAN